MTIDRSKVVAPQIYIYIYIYIKLAHQVILSAIAGRLGGGGGGGGNKYSQLQISRTQISQRTLLYQRIYLGTFPFFIFIQTYFVSNYFYLELIC